MLFRGWIWSGHPLLQWTGNSGQPLFAADVQLARLEFRRLVDCAQIVVAVVLLLGGIAKDHISSHHMDETPSVVVVISGYTLADYGALAIGAEHFDTLF